MHAPGRTIRQEADAVYWFVALSIPAQSSFLGPSWNPKAASCMRCGSVAGAEPPMRQSFALHHDRVEGFRVSSPLQRDLLRSLLACTVAHPGSRKYPATENGGPTVHADKETDCDGARSKRSELRAIASVQSAPPEHRLGAGVRLEQMDRQGTARASVGGIPGGRCSLEAGRQASVVHGPHPARSQELEDFALALPCGELRQPTRAQGADAFRKGKLSGEDEHVAGHRL